MDIVQHIDVCEVYMHSTIKGTEPYTYIDIYVVCVTAPITIQFDTNTSMHIHII